MLILNIRHPPYKAPRTFFRGCFTFNKHISKQVPDSIKDGKEPSLPRLPAGMRMEPSEGMAGWEQAGGRRGEGRGYRKEIKNAKHVLNNVFPPKLGTGCRQGFVAFLINISKSPRNFAGEVQRAQQAIGASGCPVTPRSAVWSCGPRGWKHPLSSALQEEQDRPPLAKKQEQTKRSSDFRRLTLNPPTWCSRLLLEKRWGCS